MLSSPAAAVSSVAAPPVVVAAPVVVAGFLDAAARPNELKYLS